MTNLIPFPDSLPADSRAAKYAVDAREDLLPLKRLIWLYFILLILEGALRKWVMPSMANPLLIVRDPVVVLIYIVAATMGIFPKNAFVVWTVILAGLSFFASELGGKGNLLITIYGLRTNFLHLPLIFLMPSILDAKDVHRIGKWLLIIAIPMALLVVAQFRAAPESRLNVGAGGSIGGQIEVAFGKIRPAGMFSYNTGVTSFMALVAAYVISTLIVKDSPNRKMAWVALPTVLVMIAVSGSRTSLGVISIILAGMIFICLRKRVFFKKGMQGAILLVLVYGALSFWGEFRAGLMVHESRLETGGGFQHGIVYRVLNEWIAPFRAIEQAPLLGKGLGMGTNVAAGLLFGERGFLLAEGELERVVLESGPILGFAYIIFRLCLLGYLFRRTLAALDHQENPLPLLFFYAIAPEILNGQFAVPSTLGFAVFSAGLCLAATNLGREPGPVLEAVPPAEPAEQKVRGRSLYAERLHGE